MKPTRLTETPETLLIPLWARARETKRSDAIIRDEKALEMLERIDYDFSRFESTWMSQLGVAVRTEILDRAIGEFIQRNPGAVIINLGAGLDTRHERLDNGKISWYDLDLPEVIDLKKNFFNETDRYHFISRSLFDFSWMGDLHLSGQPVLLIAEGLLVYFPEVKVREIMNELASRFPGGEMLLELLGPALVGKGRFHDTVSKIHGAEFRWSLKDSRDMETWNQKIRILEEWYFTDYHRERWGWFGMVTRFRALKKLLSNRIVHLKFDQ